MFIAISWLIKGINWVLRFFSQNKSGNFGIGSALNYATKIIIA